MQKLAEVCVARPVFAVMLILALVVVGGGFGTAAGELLLEPARQAAAAEAIAPADRRLRIVTAELGSDAGLIGAGLIGLAEVADGVQ